ncbi:hypothetical protein LOZ53_006075 [Ophidiomyces ophidiicola]|nr:hypothetical protein LOZ55_000544 [Ophidiomyces ophidiicola]KAI1982211.1 hypothetical protein LOZ54_005399 [Ophidiomyces ophidiicola]KAI1982966.1 hypothetical protein LOZ53_006075 [Ophidiomyces ophidiicola]KAI1989408.1 hypothetical protein LOZ51_005221 [Ophidiomyces ophidiicola]
MASVAHTYGPTCLLYEPPEHEQAGPDLNTAVPPPPKIRAQYFYISSLPIDDPLTAIPPPSGSLDISKLPSRPFSARDNIALEQAWQALRNSAGGEPGSGEYLREASGRLPLRYILPRGKENDVSGRQSLGAFPENRSGPHSKPLTRLPLDGEFYRNNQGGFITSANGPSLSSDNLLSCERTTQDFASLSTPPQMNRNSFPDGEEDASEDSGRSTPLLMRNLDDTNISGSPFIRAPIRDREDRRPKPLKISKDTMAMDQSGGFSTSPTNIENELSENDTTDDGDGDAPDATVTVGASRLHLVEFPKLQMKPIYWNPVQDISPVIRGTWFYKNSMLPVEPEVANQLEAGYTYLKPWTETWQDELNSCVESGAAAELKIAHKLWPVDNTKAAKRSETRPDPGVDGPASGSINGGRLTFEENFAAGASYGREAATKLYQSSSVIYVDSSEAQILRPSLLPSVASNRRPLGAIRKGRQIGILVVRGFDRRSWDELHPPKPVSANVMNFVKMQKAAMREANSRRQICYACQMEERKPEVGDLVLVIHGIGQKLSERVESFHFTHSINSFRRQVNLELGSNSVWPNMRPDLENIMVLPVNWRSTLSLEDTDVGEAIEDQTNSNHFGLKDITPETIPSVRNLISDVILDIPYYLSHHKPKMIRAVIREANRIYRLWCQNNPGFQNNGRVHLIAHSLGSVMATDILSQQPTKLPKIDFSKCEISEAIFEFDTTNAFFCGSPVGLFLLLHKSSILPRKGRNKPDCDEHDASDPWLTGRTGTYGCLAVDNLYNILHETDPIAYRLNAAIDSDLANSLKPASVPTSSTSFFQSIGSVFRWSSKPQPTKIDIPSHSAAGPSTTNHQLYQSQRPNTFQKLPSTIEMDTHDFTREEIAEKRMFLVNDNGQVDYYISGGGGPLNIQYLNMLSAHSSYWILPDFVRFIVVEIGRKAGRSGTLLALRAEKKKGWKKK